METASRQVENLPFIGVREARRLCIDLIAAEQDRLGREGRLRPEHHIHAVAADEGSEAVDDIRIDEETLGFDSLMLLDLTMEITRFFDLSTTGVEDYLLVQKSIGEWARLIGIHFDRIGNSARIGFATSGSTGSPKHIGHSREVLDSEVDGILSGILPDWSRAGRVLSGISPRHVYGFLWSVLLPYRGERDCLDVCQAGLPRAIREARPGDLVLATPFLWERLVRLGRRFQDGVTGVSSGGPTSDATWEAARALGLDRLVEVYGSTETGGVGFRTSGESAFELAPHLVRLGDGVSRGDGAPPLDLQDALRWDCHKTFVVLGRKDRVVQVAGTNVDPAIVKQAMMDTGTVRDVAIRLSGDRLKAFAAVEDLEQINAIEIALRQALQTLPAPARPDRIAFGLELPRNEIGKLQDWP